MHNLKRNLKNELVYRTKQIHRLQNEIMVAMEKGEYHIVNQL